MFLPYGPALEAEIAYRREDVVRTGRTPAVRWLPRPLRRRPRRRLPAPRPA
ncbi:MAG: hypothetical protein ACOYXW_05810 [Actinomycetota bacterium]